MPIPRECRAPLPISIERWSQIPASLKWPGATYRKHEMGQLQHSSFSLLLLWARILNHDPLRAYRSHAELRSILHTSPRCRNLRSRKRRFGTVDAHEVVQLPPFSAHLGTDAVSPTALRRPLLEFRGRFAITAIYSVPPPVWCPPPLPSFQPRGLILCFPPGGINVRRKFKSSRGGGVPPQKQKQNPFSPPSYRAFPRAGTRLGQSTRYLRLTLPLWYILLKMGR